MILEFLNEIRTNITEEEFAEMLMIAEQDIKFNHIRFNKLTKAKMFIEICMSSLILVQKEASYAGFD